MKQSDEQTSKDKGTSIILSNKLRKTLSLKAKVKVRYRHRHIKIEHAHVQFVRYFETFSFQVR